MELVKNQTATLEFRDMKFYCRVNSSIGDKLKVDALVAGALQAKSLSELPKIGLGLVKLYLCGWQGVTADGVEVPYSFDLIESSFPAELTDVLMPALVKFVKASVDILK